MTKKPQETHETPESAAAHKEKVASAMELVKFGYALPPENPIAPLVKAAADFLAAEYKIEPATPAT